MRHRLPLAVALVTVLGAAVLSVSRPGEGSETSISLPRPAPASLRPCTDAAVTMRLVTNSPVYLAGQPVRVTLETRNTGASWCRVTGRCDEVATLAIFDSGRMLWSDRPCYNADWDAVPIALAPGRLVTSRGTWTPRGVRPGWYEVRAQFLKVSFLLL